jgi:hypothetical protein
MRVLPDSFGMFMEAGLLVAVIRLAFKRPLPD